MVRDPAPFWVRSSYSPVVVTHHWGLAGGDRNQAGRWAPRPWPPRRHRHPATPAPVAHRWCDTRHPSAIGSGGSTPGVHFACAWESGGLRTSRCATSSWSASSHEQCRAMDYAVAGEAFQGAGPVGSVSVRPFRESATDSSGRAGGLAGPRYFVVAPRPLDRATVFTGFGFGRPQKPRVRRGPPPCPTNLPCRLGRHASKLRHYRPVRFRAVATHRMAGQRIRDARSEPPREAPDTGRCMRPQSVGWRDAVRWPAAPRWMR
jgi:hypothetical protein